MNFLKSRLSFYLIALITMVPWLPAISDINNLGDVRVDSSFILSMPEIFKQGLLFGNDLVFTYGPLGFLTGNIVPEAWIPLILIFRIVLVIVFCECSLGILNNRSFGFKLGYFILFGLMTLLGWTQFLWVSFPLFAVLGAFQAPMRSIFILGMLCAGCAAFISYIKFNLFLTSCGCFGIMFLFYVKERQKYSLYVSIAFFAFLILTWLGIGQPFLNLFTWVGLSLNLTSGYSEAMSKGFSAPYDSWDIFIFYISMLTLVLGSCFISVKKEIRIALFTLCLFLAIIAIQHSLGGNQIEQAMSIIILTGALLFCFGQSTKIKFDAGRILFVVTVVGGFLLLVLNNGFPKSPLLKIATLARDSATQSFYIVTRQQNKLEGFYERSLAKIRSQFPQIEALSGTTDSFPENSAVIIAFPNLRFNPRPGYLSLNAHTEKLVKLNGDFYRSERRPKNVFIEIVPPHETVNHRLPILADSDATLQVFYNYEYKSKLGPFLWFEEKGGPQNKPSLVKVKELTVKFDEPLDIDLSKPIWADMIFEKTILGLIIGNTYKMPHIDLCYVVKAGVPDVCYQLIPSMIRKGFILSPMILSTDDLADFAIHIENKSVFAPRFEKVYFKTQPISMDLWQRSFDINLYHIE